MCMAVVLRPKLSGQLHAFYTGTIYDTFIFQLCTQRFSTAVLGVLGIWWFESIFFGIHRVSLLKIATRRRTISLYMHIRVLQLTQDSHTLYSKHKLYRLVQYFASPEYFVISSSSFGVFYLQIYLDLEV